jgi:hypothetical protein
MKIGPSEVSGFTVFLQRDVRAKLVPEALIDRQQLIAGEAQMQSNHSSPVQSCFDGAPEGHLVPKYFHPAPTTL